MNTGLSLSLSVFTSHSNLLMAAEGRGREGEREGPAAGRTDGRGSALAPPPFRMAPDERTDLIHLSRPALPRSFALFLLRKEPDTGSITCARRCVCSLRNLVEHVHVVHERASEVGAWAGNHYCPFNAFLALT